MNAPTDTPSLIELPAQLQSRLFDALTLLHAIHAENDEDGSPASWAENLSDRRVRTVALAAMAAECVRDMLRAAGAA